MAKAKPMNRTSGVARRKSVSAMSESERIGRQRANEVGAAPVRDKKASGGFDLGQTAYDWLGVGSDKGKFSVDPLNLALTFVPFGLGKVATAGKLGLKAASAARKVAKVAPKSVRVAAAAKRVVRGAARRGQSAETAIQLGKGLKETGGYAKSSANAASRVPTTPGRISGSRTLYDGGEFYAPARGVTNQSLKETGKKTAYDLAQLGEARVQKGGQMIYDATKTLARTTNRVEGGTREAAAEIRRRLAALKSGRTAK
jgi:hypothetical protein